jgi:hypothetical protein
MSAGRDGRVRLDGLTGDQLEILREEAIDWLVTKAHDLPVPGPEKAEVEEVAALGRLVYGLRDGKVDGSDRMIRAFVAREASEAGFLDEVAEEYLREIASHAPWVALLVCLGGEG